MEWAIFGWSRVAPLESPGLVVAIAAFVEGQSLERLDRPADNLDGPRRVVASRVAKSRPRGRERTARTSTKAIAS